MAVVPNGTPHGVHAYVVILIQKMPSCVFKHCKSSSQKPRKADGISFHRFPTNDNMRDKWVSIVRKNRQDDNWQASRFCVVCSLHFKENDLYYTRTNRCSVKKTSKPSRNLSLLEIPIVNDDPLNLEEAGPPSPFHDESYQVISTSVQENSDGCVSIYIPPQEYQLRKKVNKRYTLISIMKEFKDYLINCDRDELNQQIFKLIYFVIFVTLM